MASESGGGYLDRLREIRRRVDRQLRDTPLVRGALAGTLDRRTYSRYLAGVAGQYAPHSPKVMGLAAGRCIDSHPDLGSYLLRHAGEEQGHSDWAVEDLRELRAPKAAVAAARPVPACAAMIGYTYYLAGHANPIALYGWMYILEAVGADLGAEAARGLRRGEQPLPVRFVGGHGAADKKHTRELEDHIRQHVTAPADQADLVEAAEVSADLYVRMFEQVTSS